MGDDLGSDHLPIEIAIDAQPHRNIHINPVKYKFNQTDREVFESTLEVALSSGDIPKLNPITYGILPFRQLRGVAFWPGSRKQGYS